MGIKVRVLHNVLVVNQIGNATIILMTSVNVILLSFFILLNSIATINEEKKKVAMGSIISSFNILDGGLTPFPDIRKEIIPPMPPMVKDEGYLAKMLMLLEEGMKLEGMSGDVGVMATSRGVVITLLDRVVFGSGDAKITEKGKAILKNVSRFLNLSNKPIAIEGHTDDIPINTKRYPSNWELSVERSISALRFMVDECKIDPARLSIAGYADTKPAVLNNSEGNRAKNRRIEIVLIDNF